MIKYYRCDRCVMSTGNKSYKQILIDDDNYNTLKEMCKTRDSFNSVITNLINKLKGGIQ